MKATANTDLGGTLGVKPTLTSTDNDKFLVVVEIKEGKVVAAGESAAIAID